MVWVLGRARSLTRGHTRSAPPNPDRTAGAEPPTHSPQPIAPTADGSGAGVAIGDRTGRILCGRRRRRRRCDPSRLSQGCLFKWAGRDAAAGARPADRPGGSVSPVLSHAADAAVLRRPCAAPHCVSAWGDVLQLSSREQVHRHDRELGRQHLQAHLSVRPRRRQSVSGTVRSGVLGAALACLAPWGCERGWCGARGAGTARGGSGSIGEAGTPEHHGGRLLQPSGRLQRRRRRCCAGTAGVLTDARQHGREARWLVCGRGGCYARYGGRHRVAHALRGTR